jgi:hypothetical protein
MESKMQTTQRLYHIHRHECLIHYTDTTEPAQNPSQDQEALRLSSRWGLTPLCMPSARSAKQVNAPADVAASACTCSGERQRRTGAWRYHGWRWDSRDKGTITRSTSGSSSGLGLCWKKMTERFEVIDRWPSSAESLFNLERFARN